MAFKDLFKRKEGGTIVGNLLRGAVHQVSGGLLGNGALMLKPGQSTAANNANAAKAAGAAAVSFTDVANAGGGIVSAPIEQNVKAGATMQTIKNFITKYWYIALGVVGVGIYFITKGRSGGRRGGR